nr:hypothetical protein [Nocardia pneumoniae]
MGARIATHGARAHRDSRAGSGRGVIVQDSALRIRSTVSSAMRSARSRDTIFLDIGEIPEQCAVAGIHGSQEVSGGRDSTSDQRAGHRPVADTVGEIEATEIRQIDIARSALLGHPHGIRAARQRLRRHDPEHRDQCEALLRRDPCTQVTVGSVGDIPEIDGRAVLEHGGQCARVGTGFLGADRWHQLGAEIDRRTDGEFASNANDDDRREAFMSSRLFVGARGGRIASGDLRKATHWDEVVAQLAYEHLRRHDLRHTGLT